MIRPTTHLILLIALALVIFVAFSFSIFSIPSQHTKVLHICDTNVTHIRVL